MLALVDRRQARHTETRVALAADPGPYLVPVGILSEIAYMVETRFGSTVMRTILADVEHGALTLDCGDDDIGRIGELIDRYADLRLGYADAAIIACAERNGGRLLTLDSRNMQIVARAGSISLLPS